MHIEETKLLFSMEHLANCLGSYFVVCVHDSKLKKVSCYLKIVYLQSGSKIGGFEI